MAIFKRFINIKAQTVEDTGFGTNSNFYGGRLINKDGSPNIRKRGLRFLEATSWFHTMLLMPWWKFLATIFLFFVSINFLFALIYFGIGTEYLGGITSNNTLEKFAQTFFFSVQTFTTVGYGHINPQGIVISAVAAIEALLGLMGFALATGLLYGRFSLPQSFLRFSKNALIAPYKDGVGLMIRMAPFKNNYLTDAEVKITIGMSIEENGKWINKFYDLPLELSKINALTLSWTIVHPINETSPVYRFTIDDFKNAKAEILVFVKAFDEAFSNSVVARTSYTPDEIIVGAKFLPMYHRSGDGRTTVLELDKLNSYAEADISFAFQQSQPSV
ncbi:MAG TPA: ion channel [Chitinophagaceae bacterium]|nr:ion channel [Chitinophagaceae bacterium]